MQLSLAIHGILSWILTAVSVALWLHERRKNNLTPFYMNLQGILKACHAKAVFYFQMSRHHESDRNEALRWQAVSNDFETLKQTVMGVMKAIEPDKDMPFSDRDYTRVGEPS